MANEVQIPLDPNPLGPMEPIFFTGTITPLSKVYADFVRSKLFGKHVREALARGILIASIDANEAKDIARIANAKSGETAERQDELEERWETVLAETTDGAEVIDARTGLRGTSWPTIKGRLDSMQAIDDKLNPVSEIFSVEHNQNCYPVVRVLAFENGLGIGPLGANLGGSNTITVNCEAEYMGRNSLKIKVPLAFAMTNPTTERISANEYLLVEGVKSLIIEVGTKAEANVETFITKEIKSDFTGKIRGSITENGNIARRYVGTAIPSSPPTGFEYGTQAAYDAIKGLDGTLSTQSTNTGVNASIPWHVIEFNTLWILEQAVPLIFKNTKTTAEKVTIAKKVITGFFYEGWAKASGPSGTLCTHSLFNPFNSSWGATTTSSGTAIVRRVITSANTSTPVYLNQNGLYCFLVYGMPSDDSVLSSVSIDYTSITITARVPFSKI